MNGLLGEVLAAHGGIGRWERYGKISATIVLGGDLFDAKGLKPDMTPRKVSTATKVERMIATPFGNPNWKMTFVPDRVVIEDGNGAVVAERSNPRNGFAGHFTRLPGIRCIVRILVATPYGRTSIHHSSWRCRDSKSRKSLPGSKAMTRGGFYAQNSRLTLPAIRPTKTLTLARICSFVATTIRSIFRGAFRLLNMSTTCRSLPDFGFQRNVVLIHVTQI